MVNDKQVIDALTRQVQDLTQELTATRLANECLLEDLNHMIDLLHYRQYA